MPTCPECGRELEIKYGEIYSCSCGYEVEIDEYDPDGDDYEEYYNEVDDMPECCKACGGPYPDCMASCKIFDD